MKFNWVGDILLDYAAIGKRIRKCRKQAGLSQEALAEKVWISATHMSHIETGSTKLSLPVLVDIAAALDVGTDELLADCFSTAKDAASNEIAALLASCSGQQVKVLCDIVKAAKLSMDKNLSP